MTDPKRHIVILGGQAYQDKDPLPEKEPGMEFWAQNALEQWITPKRICKYNLQSDHKDEFDDIDNVAMLAEVVDRWYEIHRAQLTWDLHPEHIAWLAEAQIPVYVQRSQVRRWREPTPDGDVWMDTKVYPVHEVQKLTPHGNYLAGTFSYMVAHAILEGVDKISFHWMSKAVVRSPREPRDAQPNLEYWLGVAEGRGIEVDPGNLWLLRTWWDGRYGYDGMPPEWYEHRAERQHRDFLMEGCEHLYERDSDDDTD